MKFYKGQKFRFREDRIIVLTNRTIDDKTKWDCNIFRSEGSFHSSKISDNGLSMLIKLEQASIIDVFDDYSNLMI